MRNFRKTAIFFRFFYFEFCLRLIRGYKGGPANLLTPAAFQHRLMLTHYCNWKLFVSP